MSGDYFPDRDLASQFQAAWEAELENEELRKLLIRARALLVESDNWVEWDPEGLWSDALAQFLADVDRIVGGQG